MTVKAEFNVHWQQHYKSGNHKQCWFLSRWITVVGLLFCVGSVVRTAAQTCPPPTCACYKPANNPLSGTNFSDVDKTIISKHEGGDLSTAYPPPTPKSGVTVGIGVDLGQQTATGLANMGVSPSTISVLQPYLGLKDGTASQYLAAHPLTLTSTQDADLNNHVLPSYFNSLGASFDDTAPNFDLSDLPWQAQTVLADLWYNMGNLSAAAPNLWQQMTTGDWNAAYNNLMNFTNDPSSALYQRAQSDAALLKQAMDVGTLPGMQRCPGA